MSETAHLNLPYLQAAQAQKHVTMNDALGRLDGFTAARLTAVDALTPPQDPLDGSLYALGATPSGVWIGQGGKLALCLNGGWVFLTPVVGQIAWNLATGNRVMFDGDAWVEGAVVVGENGASTVQRIVTGVHSVVAGASNVTGVIIPSHASVLGVTARVQTTLTGSGLTSWQLGVPGAADRYGSGLGVTQGSYAKGMTGTPVVYYAETELVLTATGGDFASGEVEIAVHLSEIIPPRST